eukprot:6524370-Pyramimonas_sp.AAC.1
MRQTKASDHWAGRRADSKQVRGSRVPGPGPPPHCIPASFHHPPALVRPLKPSTSHNCSKQRLERKFVAQPSSRPRGTGSQIPMSERGWSPEDTGGGGGAGQEEKEEEKEEKEARRRGR